ERLDGLVAITFDDGFASVARTAWPLLAERGLTATVFCVAGYLGGANDWPTQATGAPRLPLADAASLTALAAEGVELGAHGSTPALEEIRGWRVLIRSFSTLAIGEVLARLAGLATVLLLARRLGPAGFGVITLGLTLVGWFGLVADSGTELLNVREVARRPDEFREIASRVLGLRLTLSIVAAGAFALGVELLARSDAVRSTVVLFALALPGLALNLRWMVLGIHRARAIAV